MGEISGERVLARPLAEQHITDYLRMFSNTVRALLHVQSLESEYEYLHACIKKMREGLTHFYCLFNVGDDQLIGAIEIRSYQENRGQLYSWLNEQYWGSGYYQEALGLVAACYFEQTARTFFSVHIDVENKRSYRALKKCGGAHIGICHGAYGKQYQMIIRRR